MLSVACRPRTPRQPLGHRRRRVPLRRVIACRRWHSAVSHIAGGVLSPRTCTVSCAGSHKLLANGTRCSSTSVHSCASAVAGGRAETLGLPLSARRERAVLLVERYEDKTVVELKQLATDRQIKQPGVGWPNCCPPDGNKADIVRSLREWDAKSAATPTKCTAVRTPETPPVSVVVESPKIVRSFLHTGNDKDIDEDEGLARRREQTVARETVARETVQTAELSGRLTIRTLFLRCQRQMAEVWARRAQYGGTGMGQEHQHTPTQLADESDEDSDSDATTERPVYWEVESAAPEMHHSFLRIRLIDVDRIGVGHALSYNFRRESERSNTALVSKYQAAKPLLHGCRVLRVDGPEPTRNRVGKEFDRSVASGYSDSIDVVLDQRIPDQVSRYGSMEYIDFSSPARPGALQAWTASHDNLRLTASRHTEFLTEAQAAQWEAQRKRAAEESDVLSAEEGRDGGVIVANCGGRASDQLLEHGVGSNTQTESDGQVARAACSGLAMGVDEEQVFYAEFTVLRSNGPISVGVVPAVDCTLPAQEPGATSGCETDLKLPRRIRDSQFIVNTRKMPHEMSPAEWEADLMRRLKVDFSSLGQPGASCIDMRQGHLWEATSGSHCSPERPQIKTQWNRVGLDSESEYWPLKWRGKGRKARKLGLIGPSDAEWPAYQPSYSEGDTVGLVLDLGAGTLTAFKNGILLGVVVPNLAVPSLGAGPFNWAVDLGGVGSMVHVSDGSEPWSPAAHTATQGSYMRERLAQTWAWKRAVGVGATRSVMTEGRTSIRYGTSTRPYLLPPVSQPVATEAVSESGQWRFWSCASNDGGQRQWKVPPLAYTPSAFAITTGEPVGYISKSAPLELLRKSVVWSWADGHIQDPLRDIKFAHVKQDSEARLELRWANGQIQSAEQLELLDNSTLQRDSEAALLCAQTPDAPSSHPRGRDGFSLGSLRIIVRGQVTPVYIHDELLTSSSRMAFVEWATVKILVRDAIVGVLVFGTAIVGVLVFYSPG